MKQHLRQIVLRLLCALLCFTIPTSAAQLTDENIPPELRPWKAWVLHWEENKLCPCRYNDAGAFLCSWPSRLNLDLSRQGGKFSQQWLMHATSWIPLPGGAGQWPGTVMVDGKSAAVVARDQKPVVYLQPGSQLIEGTFTWEELPEMLQVPAESGIVALTINGSPIAFPVYEIGGQLWLQKRQTGAAQEDRLQVKIYRHLQDAIPLKVMTHLKISASGRAREVNLQGILLANAVPVLAQ